MREKKAYKPHKKKIRTMALSVLLAVILWFMVIYVNDPDITTTVSNLDVRFTGESALRDKNIALTGREDIPPLSVVITGKRSDIMNFIDDIYVQVNVNDINSAGNYTLAGTTSIPTTRITVEKENYENIPIKAEPLVEKEIDVTVKQTGALKNKLVKSEAINPRVTVSGAKSEIDKVGGALATVDISQLTESDTQRVNYLLTDSFGALINENETIESARPYVEIANTVYSAKTVRVVPAFTEELEKEYILRPEKCTVTPSSVTAGVSDGIDADSVTVMIDKLSDDGNGEYTITAPEGMYIPPESAKVKVKTEAAKKTTVRLELDVTAENVPDGRSARTDDKISVLVTGKEGSVNSENVKAVVDASGLDRGEYELPVRLVGDDIELYGDYTINVIIE